MNGKAVLVCASILGLFGASSALADRDGDRGRHENVRERSRDRDNDRRDSRRDWDRDRRDDHRGAPVRVACRPEPVCRPAPVCRPVPVCRPAPVCVPAPVCYPVPVARCWSPWVIGSGFHFSINF